MMITAFVAPYGLYKFCRVPSGLSTGAQVLTRLLDTVLSDIKYKYVFNYLDDIIIYSRSWEDHVRHVDEVLRRLGTGKLTVNPDKARFGVKQINFLRYLVTEDGIYMVPDRTRAIREFSQPKDTKGVARFIGMVNYFSKFIPKFSEIAAALNKLRKNGEKFSWGKEQQDAFVALKDAVSHPPVLCMADFEMCIRDREKEG